MNKMDWPKSGTNGRRKMRAKAGSGRARSKSAASRTIGWKGPVIVAGLAAVAIAGYIASGLLGGNDQTSVTEPLPHATAVALAPNLPPPNLLKPLSPEEAVAENAERPFVNRPDTAASHFVLRTDEQDRERALTCLTQAVYYEAGSEGADGGRAVAQVVLNRMHHPGYPASVCGVVYQGADRPTGCQFTFTCDGSLLRAPIASLWARSRKIAEDALAGKVFAPVGHATHYHADYVLPYWADSLDKTMQIGRHIFYRLRNSLGDSRSFFQRYAGSEPPLPAPSSPTIIPPQAVTPELANALLSDRTAGTITEAERAAAQADSALLADSTHGNLLTDSPVGEKSLKNALGKTPCGDALRGTRLAPLSPNDLRSDSASSKCP